MRDKRCYGGNFSGSGADEGQGETREGLSVVEKAREAAACGDWQQAYDRLVEVNTDTPLTGSALALFAEVAYAVRGLDECIEAWERVYVESTRAGDRIAAAEAATRLALHLLIDTGLLAPVRGWIRRAERLLDGQEERATDAWIAVVRMYERLLSGDFDNALVWSREAAALGGRRDPAAAALGHLAEARCLVLRGEIRNGLRLLDEAGVTAVSGEIDPLSTGIVFCELICAFQALAQYDLAEQWTLAMERWGRRQAMGSIHGRCRIHRAEILRLRGHCAEAEQEILGACEELRPYLRREVGWPLTELGRIRLRRGDLLGAEEAFRAAHEIGWDPQPGLALVHLAKGEVAVAARSIREALEHPPSVPSKEFPPNTELRNAPLLEAQVEIELTAGDFDRARAASEQLVQIATAYESKALLAGAALARGRVALAAGGAAAARSELERAVRLWTEAGAPYETALARMSLAQSLRAEGQEERAVLEQRAAHMTLERIGASPCGGETVRAPGDRPPGKNDEPAPDPPTLSRALPGDANVFAREGDYWLVAFQGREVRIRDMKGLRYLATLLAHPGREVLALDLVAFEQGGTDEVRVASNESGLARTRDLDSGAWLDGRAKEAYRRRLAEIEEDIEEAQAMGDGQRSAAARMEREFLVRELARAVGLGGRDRLAGSHSERARASVTRAIRQAMMRIQKHHRALAEHLTRAVRTGTYCAYLPDPRLPPAWRL